MAKKHKKKKKTTWSGCFGGPIGFRTFPKCFCSDCSLFENGTAAKPDAPWCYKLGYIATAKITECAFKKKTQSFAYFPHDEFGTFGDNHRVNPIQNHNNLPGTIQNQSIVPTAHKRSYYDRERYKPLYGNDDLPVDDFGGY